MAVTCCTHDCGEGRDCIQPATLHRVPFLHTEEGGRAVSGGFGVSLSMPIAEVPEPIPTPEQAEGWARAWQWFLVAVTLVCLAFVAIAYFNS